jgi:uncharacterized protein (TIGR02145 family)
MKKILLFASLSFITCINQAQTVTDIDGNVYDTIHIGTQVWLKENLKTTRYNDGTAIPLVTDSAIWSSKTTPAYCWYNNDSANKNPYGGLYNWYTVNTGKLCPSGWHVPSDAEWHSLILKYDPQSTMGYHVESTTAGDFLKEAGSAHWNIYNTGNNSSGFTALPVGEMNTYFKTFINFHASGFYWSSTPNGAYSTAYHRIFNSTSGEVDEYLDDKASGMAVRCLQGITTGGMTDQANRINVFNVYPNPAVNNIYIDCKEEQNIEMHLYNLLGELVLQSELSTGKNNIDVHSLLKGIYIIQFTGPVWSAQLKFSKE